MTSQELVTSKSHISQDHHGDTRSRLQRVARDARLPRRCMGSFLFLSFYFFFQFPFLASLRFLFVSATLTYSWQLTGVACRSAFEVAPLLESSKPWVAHRSRRWRTRRKGRRRRRKKGSACFERERERERERDVTNKSRLLLSISYGASCFSLTSRRAGIHAHERKQIWDSAAPFRFDQPRQAIIPCELTRHDLCAWLFASTGTATRELDLRCWDWTRTFPLRVDLPGTGKIRWQNVCSNNCSFTLKEKSEGDDMVRHKSSKLKKHNEKSMLVERQLQKARGVRTHWKCIHRRDREYGTPW